MSNTNIPCTKKTKNKMAGMDLRHKKLQNKFINKHFKFGDTAHIHIDDLNAIFLSKPYADMMICMLNLKEEAA
jgi:hypothetical protein|tara:strand:+ start:245 stop:463 length:219 start_codon:yes stop_codon:yes gene_type:complete